MSDQVIGVLQAGSPDRKLDTTELTVGANTVQRERHNIAGAAAAEIASVKAASTAAVATDGALVVAISPNTPSVTDGINAAAVKAASTAAVAADKALVVAVSPNNTLPVAGNAASGASDAGNPVKVGGPFNTTQPTVTTGQRVDAQMTARGGLIVASGVDPLVARVSDGTNTAAVLAGADGLAVGNGLVSDSELYLFNGTTWDRRRGNWNTSTGDSGTKTTTFAGATQTNFDSYSAIITVRLGTVSGTSPTLACQFQYSPDAGTTWINLGAVLGNLTASNQNGVIVIGPVVLTGLTSGGTQTALIVAPLPRTWRINYTIGGTTPSFAITAVNVNYTIG